MHGGMHAAGDELKDNHSGTPLSWGETEIPRSCELREPTPKGALPRRSGDTQDSRHLRIPDAATTLLNFPVTVPGTIVYPLRHRALLQFDRASLQLSLLLDFPK
jgi:hypothetical protein